MRQLTLIFLSTLFILLIGLLFGYKQLILTYSVSDQTKELSKPLNIELDTDFIRSQSF